MVPTLIQERGGDARPIEAKRAELAACPRDGADAEEVEEIGDRRQHRLHDAEGRARPTTRAASDRTVAARRRLREIAATWGIDPERDLALR